MYASILNPARARAMVIAAAALMAANVVAAQQSELSITPFMSFRPSGSNSPLAGLALTLGGNSGFALRGSAHIALDPNTNSTVLGASETRVWGADADAVLFFGGRSWNGSRSIAPFVFAGVGTSGTDTRSYDSNHSNWSYGAGATIPLAGAVDLFGESRWRMPEFVLPTAPDAPSPRTEFRVGLSFHISSR